MPVKFDKKYRATIGLEVHAQLLTASKMFCGCGVEYDASPNSLTCPVCLGLPGALPVLNKKAVEYAVRVITALGGEVRARSVFARKNYFYPDLPKGYQISQYKDPIGLGGYVSINQDGSPRKITLTRIHLEEDAGKSLHSEEGEDHTRIDLNRCGVPLLEIVTEPVIESPEEAHAFLTGLRQLLQYLNVCSGDMEKGALRCDANISVRSEGRDEFGTRTELKNLNSFKAVQRALEYEIKRQTTVLESDEQVLRETLLWDEKAQKTAPMRGKEESEDYRYFPEPDLIPIELDSEWIDLIKSALPELPVARMKRLMADYGLSSYDAAVLTESRALADYFEAVAKEIGDGKLSANWVMVEVLRIIHENKIAIGQFLVQPFMLVELLISLKSNIISGRIAKAVFEEMVKTGKRAPDIIEDKGLKQITDREQLAEIVINVLRNEENHVLKYRSGKTGLFDFFVGQVMKETQGRANPELVNEILKEKLDGR